MPYGIGAEQQKNSD
jgi:hypothetical protein